ncbi:TPA: recombinase family protein, partial [Klebsiella pneumoniae]
FILLQSDQKQNKPGYKSEHNAFAGILKHECGGALVRKFHVVSGKTYQYHVCANARDGKCNVTKNFKNIEVALYRIMKELKLEKKTSIDETLLLERNSVKAKIQELNDMLLNLSKIPISVIQTINNLEEKLQQLEENIKHQNSMIISEQAFDFKLLQEIKDPQELNMMLKRVIEQIIVFNIGKRWRVKVLYRNKHSQSFIWDGEKISFISDTKKLLELF